MGAKHMPPLKHHEMPFSSSPSECVEQTIRWVREKDGIHQFGIKPPSYKNPSTLRVCPTLILSWKCSDFCHLLVMFEYGARNQKYASLLAGLGKWLKNSWTFFAARKTFYALFRWYILANQCWITAAAMNFDFWNRSFTIWNIRKLFKKVVSQPESICQINI